MIRTGQYGCVIREPGIGTPIGVVLFESERDAIMYRLARQQTDIPSTIVPVYARGAAEDDET